MLPPDASGIQRLRLIFLQAPEAGSGTADACAPVAVCDQKSYSFSVGDTKSLLKITIGIFQ